MATTENNAEGGTNGTTVTIANSGGLSGDAFNTIAIGTGGTVTYDNQTVFKGYRSYKIAQGGTAAASYLQWTTTATDQWGRVYLYLTANPSVALPFAMATTNVQASISLQVNTTGTVSVVDTNGVVQATSTNTIALSAWIRLEFHMTLSATVGFGEIKLFNSPNSVTPTETLTSAATLNTGTSQTKTLFGMTASNIYNQTIWLDSLNLNTTGYPGPDTKSTPLQINNYQQLKVGDGMSVGEKIR